MSQPLWAIFSSSSPLPLSMSRPLHLPTLQVSAKTVPPPERRRKDPSLPGWPGMLSRPQKPPCFPHLTPISHSANISPHNVCLAALEGKALSAVVKLQPWTGPNGPKLKAENHFRRGIVGLYLNLQRPSCIMRGGPFLYFEQRTV